MNWKQYGDYAVRCQPWTISAASIDGVFIYQLWHDDKPDPIAKADTAAELKKQAERIGGE